MTSTDELTSTDRSTRADEPTSAERGRPSALLDAPTSVELRPRYEGSNICTWIGFKHVNYLVEEALLEHFRRAGLSARRLYEIYGLGLDLVVLDTRIVTALHMDDLVRAEVVAVDDDGEARAREGGEAAEGAGERGRGAGGGRFRVRLHVERNGSEVKGADAKAVVALRVDDWHEDAVAPWPAGLERMVAPTLGATPPERSQPAVGANGAGALSAGRGVSDGDDLLARLTAGQNAFGWRWRIPYMYCHFSERMQMSGYLRQMEEVVDLFLARRGISIRQLLDDRRWIPVVPHSRIEILEEALMEEDLYTIYTVERVFKGFTYSSRMDCYVVRDGATLKTATGEITHGYAHVDNRRDWSLVGFDERVLAALGGGTEV